MAEYTITDPKGIRIKSLLLSDIQDYTYANVFYVLFKQSVLTPTQYNRLKRQFAGKPQFRFMNAVDFWEIV